MNSNSRKYVEPYWRIRRLNCRVENILLNTSSEFKYIETEKKLNEILINRNFSSTLLELAASFLVVVVLIVVT